MTRAPAGGRGGDSFTCPHCGRTSYNPRDREERYCGACHWWTGVPELYEPWRAERDTLDESASH